jgi:hypothetical protein
MHQTLKHLIKVKGDQLISLWQLFDETVSYEEDPQRSQCRPGLHQNQA